MRSLTIDTSSAIYQTCHGLINLAKDLINSGSHSFVALGKFTTDPIERAFGKLRQGSGGTYFINTQQIMEKWNISKAKLILQENSDSLHTILGGASGHSCEFCFYRTSEDECEKIKNLENCIEVIADEIKSSLVYIAGYVF